MCYTFSLTRVPESAASTLQDSYKSVFATEKMSVLIILSDALTYIFLLKLFFSLTSVPESAASALQDSYKSDLREKERSNNFSVAQTLNISINTKCTYHFFELHSSLDKSAFIQAQAHLKSSLISPIRFHGQYF